MGLLRWGLVDLLAWTQRRWRRMVGSGGCRRGLGLVGLLLVGGFLLRRGLVARLLTGRLVVEGGWGLRRLWVLVAVVGLLGLLVGPLSIGLAGTLVALGLLLGLLLSIGLASTLVVALLLRSVAGTVVATSTSSGRRCGRVCQACCCTRGAAGPVGSLQQLLLRQHGGARGHWQRRRGTGRRSARELVLRVALVLQLRLVLVPLVVLLLMVLLLLLGWGGRNSGCRCRLHSSVAAAEGCSPGAQAAVEAAAAS